MIYTPLEQFSIVSLIPITLGNVYLSFTNSSLYLFLATGLVVLIILFSDTKWWVFSTFTLAITCGNDL